MTGHTRELVTHVAVEATFVASYSNADCYIEVEGITNQGFIWWRSGSSFAATGPSEHQNV